MTKKQLEAKLAALEAKEAARLEKKRNDFKRWLDTGDNRARFNEARRKAYHAKKAANK